MPRVAVPIAAMAAGVATMPMRVAVAVVVTMRMAMVVIVIVVVRMIAGVSSSCALAVRNALRLERLLGLAHDQVLAAEHLGQGRVTRQPEKSVADLQRHLPAAQVVGGAHEVGRRAVVLACADDEHRL